MFKLINQQVVISNAKIVEVPLEDQVLMGNPKHVIKLLDVGDRVRVMLDNPQDLHGKTLFGKFRAGDIRWKNEIRTVKEVLMKPGEPIMYLLNGDTGPLNIEPVGYTYNQLQKVSENEKVPEIIVENETNRFEVAKITDRRKVGRSFEYLVWWKPSTEPKSWEKRKGLVEDLGTAYMDKLDKRFDAKQSKR